MSKAVENMRAMLAKRDKLVAIGVDLDEGGTGVFVEYTRKLLAVAEAAEALINQGVYKRESGDSFSQWTVCRICEETNGKHTNDCPVSALDEALAKLEEE